jgi:hypothetical protein
MLPNFLLSETVTRQNGTGPEIELGPSSGRPVLLTLGITRIIEQESLDVEVWGSVDKSSWGDKPILRFPQKFYCGTYSMMLNLVDHPEVQYLRINYKLNRWGRGEPAPLFGFYVFGEEATRATSQAEILHAAVA